MKLGIAKMVKVQIVRWLKDQLKSPHHSTDHTKNINTLIKAVKAEKKDMLDAWRIKLDFEAVMGSEQGEISWRKLSADVVTYCQEIN
jgi:hypothetical protein